MPEPTRYLSPEDRLSLTPVHAVWELTLACDLKCRHCGSRAGKTRSDELTTDECLNLVRQLARLGTREVTLIGGEAYLRRDWLKIIHEIREQGMDCGLQSGGLHLTEDRVKSAAEAGLQALGVSVDGLSEVHDDLRGVAGSFDAAFKALHWAKKYGIESGVNTQITSLVIPQLPELMDLIIASGAKGWQVQLTVAMGRAADHPDLLLQPYELLELMPLLARLYRESADRGLLLLPGNNIGYFGPYESLLRGSGDDRVYWSSCNAGKNTVGIEADGTIKGCPSLPTSPYSGGNVRDLSLDHIWWKTEELSINRTRTNDELWGFCRGCYYAEVCKAGCTWTTHVLFGRAGNNPYCHHRALELSKQGLRERIVQVEKAPGIPFDHGRFELIVEAADGRNPAPALSADGVESQLISTVGAIPLSGSTLVQIAPARKLRNGKKKPKGTSAAGRESLILCRGCQRHVTPDTKVCPFCEGDVRGLAKLHDETMQEARNAYLRLVELLSNPMI